MRQIDASDDVSLTAQPEGDDPLDLDSDTLTIHLARAADGQVQPTRLLATGHIDTRQPDMRLQADEKLEITFNTNPHATPTDIPRTNTPQTNTPKTTTAPITTTQPTPTQTAVAQTTATQPTAAQPTTTPTAATQTTSLQPTRSAATSSRSSAPDQPHSASTQPATIDITAAAGVERMLAVGNVRVQLKNPNTELVGQRLVADTAADQFELFAPETGDSQALVVRDDGVLAGRHIIMRRSDRTAHVQGAGWFDAQMAADNPADKLKVTWNQSMSYNDTTGHARFVGQVRAATSDPTARTRLTCDNLSLQLAPAQTSQSAATSPAATQPTRSAATSSRSAAPESNTIAASTQPAATSPAPAPPHLPRGTAPSRPPPPARTFASMPSRSTPTPASSPVTCVSKAR